MGGTLTFGTAGIRGEVGPGSNRMNRAVVIKTTRGLADYLIEPRRRPARCPGDRSGSTPARRADSLPRTWPGSWRRPGSRSCYFPEVTPTPLVAFTAKHVGRPGGGRDHRQPQPAGRQRVQGLRRRTRPRSSRRSTPRSPQPSRGWAPPPRASDRGRVLGGTRTW